MCSTISNSQGSTLALWKTLLPPPQTVGEGESSLTCQEAQIAWACSFSGDGTHLAACYGSPDPCIRMWDTSTWELMCTLRSNERTIRSIAFAPSTCPLILASASFDGTVVIWEHVSSSEWECTAQLEGHDNEIKCVVWNATGSLLATCGRDKSVWIWESFLPGTVGGPAPAGLQPLPSASSGGGDFDCLAVLNGHEGDVKCVRFAASHGQWGDGDDILISSSYDETIKVWAEDAGDWYCAASITSVHAGTIWTLTVAPSSTRLLSGSDDGSISIYQFYTARQKAEYFPYDDLSGSKSNGLIKCVGILPFAHEHSAIYSIDYAPSKCGHGRIATGGGDNCIHVYREGHHSKSDQPQFMLDARVKTQYGDVNCVSWHPWDGSMLASTCDDSAVQVWKFSSAQ